MFCLNLSFSLQMQFCGCLLFSGLLSIILLRCGIDGLRVQLQVRTVGR